MTAPAANHTPTTENVRNCYVYSNEMYDGSLAVPVYVATAEFDRWLAAHDADVATAERERLAALLTADAEVWQATADRLFDESEYIDATRYQHYAIARGGAAREVAANFPKAALARSDSETKTGKES